MAANFLSLIKGEGLAVQAIKSLVSQNVPGSQILQQVADMGLTIRPNVGTQIINYLVESYLPAGEYIEALDLDSYPQLNKLPFSVTNMLRNFAYTVEINGTDQFDGGQISKNITISSNQLLTKQQAITAAENISAGDTKSGNVVDGEGTIVSITQNNAGLVTDNNPLGASGVYSPIGYAKVRSPATYES